MRPHSLSSALCTLPSSSFLARAPAGSTRALRILQTFPFHIPSQVGIAPLFGVRPRSSISKLTDAWATLTISQHCWSPRACAPLVCTHRMKVGYSSAFTRHTIWNTMVIPIRPRQATVRFNQCKSGEEAQGVWNTSARSYVPRKLGLQSWNGWEDCLI